MDQEIHLKKRGQRKAICIDTSPIKFSHRLFEVTCPVCLDIVMEKRIKQLEFISKAKAKGCSVWEIDKTVDPKKFSIRE